MPVNLIRHGIIIIIIIIIIVIILIISRDRNTDPDNNNTGRHYPGHRGGGILFVSIWSVLHSVVPELKLVSL
jgi:hypothetical protein